MRQSKILAGTALFATLASVVTSIVYGQLYPSIVLGAAIASICLGFLAITTTSHIITLLTIVCVSVVRNVWIFVFPASVIGLDPNRDTRVISQIVSTGTIDNLAIGFYSEVPFYHLLAGIFEIVSNITYESPLSVYPILMGILIPCTSYIIAYRLSNRRLANLSALFATTITLGIKFSYWPVPQTLAVLLCYTMFILWIRNRPDIRKMGISLIILAALIFIHKIPLLFLFLSFFTVSVVAFTSDIVYERRLLYWLSVCGIMVAWQAVVSSINSIIIQITGMLTGILASLFGYKHNAQKSTLKKHSYPVFPSIYLAIMSGVFLIVQWFYVTVFVQKAVLKISSLFSLGGYFTAESITPSAASVVDPGRLDILYHYSETLLLMIGVAILLVGYSIFEQRPDPYFVSFTGTGLILTGIVSIDSSAGSPFRFLLFIIPLGAVIILLNFRRTSQLNLFNYTHILGIVFVVILLLFQITSIFFVPDYTGTPRSYLDESEMSTKSSLEEYGIDGRVVYTDQYSVSIKSSPNSDMNYTQSEELYLESSYSELERSNYILYRYEKIIRLNGNWWTLKWRPSMLDREFNRIYSAGDSSIYTTEG